MVKTAIPTLNVLVAGDPCTGKTNFINRFFYYYPPSAELRRKHDTIHFMYKADRDFKIQLHDASNIQTIDHQLYNNMDIIFFCYAANDRRSFQNLEPWIRLMKGVEKEVHSFLVADKSNVGSQRDVSELLAKQACELKDTFGISWFIKASFDDEESSAIAFRTILNKVPPPKLNENFSFGELENEIDEYSKKLAWRKHVLVPPTPHLVKVPPSTS